MLLALQAGPPPLPLVPLPAVVRPLEGGLDLSRGVRVTGGGVEGRTLTEELRTDGLKVGRRGATIALKHVEGLPAEGYRLHVDRDGATVEATTDAGLFYGGQTLRQLVRGDRMAAADVDDAPRFAWRGMLLDVSRHFRPVPDVERLIDLNARLKLNVFHWHLTDDGGWRMESKAYPALTSRGAWRSSPTKGHWSYRDITFPETRRGDEYGGFYTRAEIKEVVAFAAKRHVTIVPEIELPGHEIAALQTYPWLGCDDPKHRTPTALCPGKETTYEFLQKVLDDAMALFPSKFIHVGGDEVDKSLWRDCPRCQERMAKEGLKSVDELQSYLIRRMDAYLASKGRRLVGWDEILEGGLAPGATVMSWRGIEGGIAAAKAGRDVVMSPTSNLYFDYSYEAIPTSQAYAYDPVPATLTPEEARHVLGAQGNVWTEWLPDEKDVEGKAYPRMAALAEVAWTRPERKSWPEFNARLGGVLATWDRLGVAYHVDAPVVERTAYLTDEPIPLPLPAGHPGWALRIDRASDRQWSDFLTNSEGPVPFRQPLEPGERVTYAYESGTGIKSPPVTIEVARGDRRDSADGLMPGVVASGVAGTFDRVRPFGEVAGTVVNTIDLATKPAPERFAMRFRGYIRLPQTGDYTFALRSDDGSVLKIGGLTVVDHDGEHAPVTKVGHVWAKAGVYPFELGYFDAGGANSLSLAVTPPSGTRGPIPADWLWH